MKQGLLGNPVYTLLGQYGYNALHQQTVRTADPEPAAAGPYEQRRSYYLLGWQLAEEHVDSSYDASMGFVRDRVGQFVYGSGGIDDAFCRRIDGNADGDYTDAADSHWSLLRDIQGSVVAVVDEVGDIAERVQYDPWGRARHSWPEDFDGDGDVDAADGSFYSPLAASSPVVITSPLYNADLDLDLDGDIDGDDQSSFAAAGYKPALASGFVSDRHGPDNPFGYASYQHRHYDPRLRVVPVTIIPDAYHSSAGPPGAERGAGQQRSPRGPVAGTRGLSAAGCGCTPPASIR